MNTLPEEEARGTRKKTYQLQFTVKVLNFFVYNTLNPSEVPMRHMEPGPVHHITPGVFAGHIPGFTDLQILVSTPCIHAI